MSEEKLPVTREDSLRQLVSLACEIKMALTANYGEVDDALAEKLLKLEQKLPNKADGYKFIIDDLESESALWKKRAQDFLKIAKAFQNYADLMTKAIEGACKQMDTEEILGHEYRWKLQRSKPTVIIDDATKIPSGHKEIVQTTNIKKDSILEDLKMGLPVPGAHLEESLHVRCYANTQAVKEQKNVRGKKQDAIAPAPEQPAKPE